MTNDKPTQNLAHASLPIRYLLGLWGVTALLTTFSFWQRPYLLVLVSPFRVQLTLALLLLGIPLCLLVRRANRWVFLALPLVVGTTFLPYLRSAGDVPTALASPPLSIALANIYSGNTDLSRLTAWVEQEKPEVLVLLEVTENHRAQIEALPYAFKLIHPQQSNFGIALLSQVAPTEAEVLEGDSPFPSILAAWPDHRILATHPIPPISPTARQIGDSQLQRLADGLVKQETPLLVVGDLNATGWDARLEPFKVAGLKDSRIGHGILATWPVGKPFMAIPLDHILLPKTWQSQKCALGPDIGSDHYPLVAQVAGPQVPPTPTP